MGRSFRQSMTWLHTWTGLLVGWVLFFVFLTGTFGYVNDEVDHWMRPEQPILSVFPPSADLVSVAEQRLRQRGANAELWQIIFPGVRGFVTPTLGWRAPPAADQKFGPFTREPVASTTGTSNRKVRETGGGNTLYIMHYALHYMPPLWGNYLVGICTMFMLVAILTGVVAHKKIFKDFFTFRPAKGQRSWLDGHNLLAVTALPFHVMITWSGLVFFLFTYMPVAVDTLYPEGATRERFLAESYGTERPERAAVRPSAAMVSLAPLLRQAEDRWGGAGTVAVISVDNPNRDNARITFFAHETDRIDRTRPFFRFDGVTGMLLASGDGAETVSGRFNGALLGLHEGRFAEPVLRFLYVFAGLAGTAMIGTGLVLWSTKRKAKLKRTDKPAFGLSVVDTLNLGTIIGLPIGIAAYFWANRLLPVDMAGRAAWEANVMFITWGLTFLYAALRPLNRSWFELCWFAAAACAFLPLLNALTTDRNLWASIQSDDWIFIGFDLSALAAGAFFAAVAQLIRRKQRAAVGATVVIPTNRTAREAGGG
jgi:uncharacterized iron-regulated membrane protein